MKMNLVFWPVSAWFDPDTGRNTSPLNRATLIVCPLSVMHNWQVRENANVLFIVCLHNRQIPNNCFISVFSHGRLKQNMGEMLTCHNNPCFCNYCLS